MSEQEAVSFFPGHGDKPDGWDPGTRSPRGWTEADLVREVVAAAWLASQRRHIPSEVVSAGSYGLRGLDADAGSGSRLVVQVHVDAGGADRSTVFFYPNNERGEAAANRIAQELRRVVPWPVVVRAADDGWRDARACLAAVRATSVLVELGFADGPIGQVVLPALAKQLGEALAQAV